MRGLVAAIQVSRLMAKLLAAASRLSVGAPSCLDPVRLDRLANEDDFHVKFVSPGLPRR